MLVVDDEVRSQDAMRRTLQRGLSRLELRAGTSVLRARRGDRLAQVRSASGFDRIERASGSPLDAVREMAAQVARCGRAPARSGSGGP
ncbi:hypothetical protein C7444_10942 [Sphaerotilus hippei]|uniref:Uncharacterized protein n=1 Tax=Sphaerotilus hippei TaxID=744406 RepID=A0A318H3A8_9BURK|nr:hypothetical protein [Sphaerotilus hippei]PXW95474.1 hypothetical protein C7444_10942 [Sphaerotilus hippei]